MELINISYYTIKPVGVSHKRTFNKKIYTFDSWIDSKKYIERRVSDLKKRGFLVRVVPGSAWRQKTNYIYKRKKP